MVNSVAEESVLAGSRGNSGPPDGQGGDYDRPLVLSYMQIRRCVGGIGVLLPFVLFFGNKIIGYGVQPSMSGYYYTPMRNIFVGSLCALAIFLITYEGWDRADTVITDLAGIGTFGTALCPTSPVDPTGHQAVVGIFHLTFACLTFFLLAVMSLRFAKRMPTPSGISLRERVCYAFGFTPPGRSQATTAELVIYRASGFVILLCLALIYPMSKVYSHSLLVLEMILLASFGAAWFTKGTTLLRRTGGGPAVESALAA
jgi:hypothetical protein